MKGCNTTPWVLILLLSQGTGTGQTKEPSASDLIHDLTQIPVVVAGSLGERYWADEHRRVAIEALVKLGASALPDIETALDSIEKRGRDSEFATIGDSLLMAYSKIKGPAAFPRLREMRTDPRFSYYVDDAAALSLGLTSYVRAAGWRQMIMSAELLRAFHRSNDSDPKFALDFLILAWVKNDREMLEEQLGPNARTALDSLLKDTTWEAMRARLGNVKLTDKVAVGYRFEGVPLSALANETSSRPAPYAEKPDLDTTFKDGSGKDCGRERIRFLGRDSLIDNSDIEDLLRVISTCAANE